RTDWCAAKSDRRASAGLQLPAGIAPGKRWLMARTGHLAIHGEPQSEVLCTWMQVRGDSPLDSGEVALIHYIVRGGNLELVDAQGERLEDRERNRVQFCKRSGNNRQESRSSDIARARFV